MDKKKSISCFAAIGIFAVCFVSFKVFGDNKSMKMTEIAEKTKTYEQTKKNSKLLAKVNDEDIYADDLSQARLTRNDNLSDTELLDVLIDNKALLKEAKEKSLEATDNEIQATIKDQKEHIKANNDQSNQLNELIKSYGVSEEEYWNTLAYTVYKTMISRQNVLKYYYNNDADVSKCQTDKEKHDKVMEKIRQKSKIEKF